MSRGRPESLCQWMSLNTWIGMVVDAMLKSTADKKASAIYRTILGQKGSALLDSILGPLALAVESGSTMHSSMEGLDSMVIQLLTLAAKIWTCSNIPQELPTKEWLREYLLVTLGSGVYDAWEKKDLIWAIYNYFTWRKPEKTDAGVIEAIYDLAILAGLPIKPIPDSKILPALLSTYKMLGLEEVADKIERLFREVADSRRRLLCLDFFSRERYGDRGRWVAQFHPNNTRGEEEIYRFCLFQIWFWSGGCFLCHCCCGCCCCCCDPSEYISEWI